MSEWKPSSFFMTTTQLTKYVNRYIMYAVLLFLVMLTLFMGDW